MPRARIRKNDSTVEAVVETAPASQKNEYMRPQAGLEEYSDYSEAGDNDFEYIMSEYEDVVDVNQEYLDSKLHYRGDNKLYIYRMPRNLMGIRIGDRSYLVDAADISQIHGARYHRVKDVSSGDLTHEGLAEAGILQPEQEEYFLRLPPALPGRMVFGKKTVVFDREMPRVLWDKEVMPSIGCSGLPQSLESSVPENLRYWTMPLSKAREARDWLIDTNYFTRPEIEMRPVNGKFQFVEVERNYYIHKPEKIDDIGWTSHLLSKMPEGIEVHSPFMFEDWRQQLAMNRDKLAVLDAPTELGLSIEELMGLAELCRNYLMVLEDKENVRQYLENKLTPEQNVFKLTHPAAWDKLFVCNYKVDGPGYRLIGKPFANFANFDACVSQQMSNGHSQESANRICGALQARLEGKQEELTKEADCPELSFVRMCVQKEQEEQFVYGIVAEPDETDTQGDTQDAETIRAAAYGFMENFRNIGLQHQDFINDKVKILESFIAPIDMEVAGNPIKKGSWLMGVRINDPNIWQKVKNGELTGFSFGGTALRNPLKEQSNNKNNE